MIKIKVKLGNNDVRTINVEKTEQINCMLHKLNIADKMTKFVFKGETYSMSSILTFEEIGLISNCSIVAITQVKAAEKSFSSTKIIFEPTEKSPDECLIKTEGPFYLSINDGINLFGFCQNKNCLAYKKVTSHFGYGNFDLIEDLTSKSYKCPKCPLCEYNLLDLESCKFMNCKYNYKGIKLENKKEVDVEFNKGETKEIDYIFLGNKDENKNKWNKIKIYATPL